MGYTQNSHFYPQISTAFFITLLILRSTHARFTPRGRSNSKLIDNYNQGARAMRRGTQHTNTDTGKTLEQLIGEMIDNYEDEDYGHMGIRDMMIGSKPPRCELEKYCRECGKCEAIQVPISKSSNTTTRRDDISNYKPMCWKCKCGDFTFNP